MCSFFPIRARLLLVRALSVTLLCVVVACGGRPPDRPGSELYRVGDVQLDGVTAFDRRDILDVLETQENNYNPFSATQWLNRFAVVSDIDRIRTFYHLRGYFDAEVRDYRITYEEDRRRPRADISWDIVEGEPSTVTRISYDLRQLRQIDQQELVAGLGLRLNERFDHAKIEKARATLRARLQESSYAYARVDVRVYADRAAKTVEVYFFFDQGPACLFGDILVEGNRQIRSDMIRDRVRLRPGTTYRHSLLRLTQIDLYDMQAFGFVQVEPLLPGRQARWESIDLDASEASDTEVAALDASLAERGLTPMLALRDETERPPEVANALDILGEIQRVDPRVNVRITVSEQPAASYRVGGGIGLESGRSETYGRANAVWRNVLLPLNVLEGDLRGGYAWIPSLFTDERSIEGVIGSAELKYRRPGALFRIIDLAGSFRVERNLRDEYAYLKPSASIALQRRLNEFTRVELGYTIDIVRTVDEVDLQFLGSGSCQELPETYRLTHADFRIQTDRRNNPLHALEGFYSELNVELGVDGPIGDFSYLQIQPDVRYYQPISRRLSLAGRVQAGTILDFSANVPRSQCLYQGGGDTIRGFPERKLSPYEGDVAVGGLTSWNFNFEPRFEIGRGWLYGAVFLDGGSVARDSLTFRFDLGGEEGLHLATGAGLRFLTPIGPFRFDVGYRLTSGPAYGTSTWDRIGFYLSIGEAF